MSVLYFALLWVVGSVAAALFFGRWLKLQPLSVRHGEPPGRARAEGRGDGLDPLPSPRQEGDLDLDDQPVSRVNTISRPGAGQTFRSSRSA